MRKGLLVNSSLKIVHRKQMALKQSRSEAGTPSPPVGEELEGVKRNYQ